MSNTRVLSLLRHAPRRIAQALVATALLLACQVSHAAATAQAAISSTDDLGSILLTYGPSIGAMYALYQIARSLITRAAGTDPTPGVFGRIVAWLRVGKRLAYATSLLGIATAAIQALISSAPWTVILAAAVAAAFKLLVPHVPLPDSATRSSETGPSTTPAVVSVT